MAALFTVIAWVFFNSRVSHYNHLFVLTKPLRSQLQLFPRPLIDSYVHIQEIPLGIDLDVFDLRLATGQRTM